MAPGAQSGLFNTVGRLDPHSYRPNEFFANNWVYEGLVAYVLPTQISNDMPLPLNSHANQSMNSHANPFTQIRRERRHRTRARRVLDHINRRFQHRDGGYIIP